MGFKEIRDAAIKALQEGRVQAEERADMTEKNLLKTGEVSAEEVIKMLKQTRGNQHEVSPHHVVPDIEVHVCKPKVDNEFWYIKFYFIEPDCTFISVHKSRKSGKVARK